MERKDFIFKKLYLVLFVVLFLPVGVGTAELHVPNETDVVLNSKSSVGMVLAEFPPVVNAGVTEDEVGINFVTDERLGSIYLQFKPTVENSWANADSVKTKMTSFSSGNFWRFQQRHFTSHEVHLTGLQEGMVYDYRFCLRQNRPCSPEYSFKTAVQAEKNTIYLLADLQVPDRNPASFKLFTHMLEVLKKHHPNGRMMVQIGDLVNVGGKTEHWDDVLTYVYQDLDLLLANLLGNHEVNKDIHASHLTNFFNLPKNGTGTIKETNYSFDYGDVHIAVMNTVYMNNEANLA
ncbi:fibronectin type III domain-containing protein [Bacillus sp. B15-48]|uniref:fibronectin type III domain-containing protein n=1 Tax=Bacillus sp. B15-48 TaxID=1548601 RepID=UPI00193FB2BD|nr:fibronectin type III domain-containing protein [Bacillus sp. B15-48]